MWTYLHHPDDLYPRHALGSPRCQLVPPPSRQARKSSSSRTPAYDCDFRLAASASRQSVTCRNRFHAISFSSSRGESSKGKRDRGIIMAINRAFSRHTLRLSIDCRRFAKSMSREIPFPFSIPRSIIKDRLFKRRRVYVYPISARFNGTWPERLLRYLSRETRWIRNRAPTKERHEKIARRWYRSTRRNGA